MDKDPLEELLDVKASWNFDAYIYDWYCTNCGYSPGVDDLIVGPRFKECPKCKAKMRNPGEVMRRIGEPIKEKVVDRIGG